MMQRNNVNKNEKLKQLEYITLRVGEGEFLLILALILNVSFFISLPSGWFPSPMSCSSNVVSIMFLEEHSCGQIGDPDSHQYHQQAYRHPDGPVGGQQGVERHRQEGAKIDCAMNHHGDRKVIGPPVEPGQQDANDKRRWPGNHVVYQRKKNRREYDGCFVREGPAK